MLRSAAWPLLPSRRRFILQRQMKATSCLLIQSGAAAPQLRTCQSVCRNGRRTSERRVCVSAVHQLPGSKVDKRDGFFFQPSNCAGTQRGGGSEVTDEAFVAACKQHGEGSRKFCSKSPGTREYRLMLPLLKCWPGSARHRAAARSTWTPRCSPPSVALECSPQTRQERRRRIRRSSRRRIDRGVLNSR